MAEITTIAELGTAGGTLVLAIATFSATRSANRSARIAEKSLLVGMRPTLVASRPEDRSERVDFAGAGSTDSLDPVDRVDSRQTRSIFLGTPQSSCRRTGFRCSRFPCETSAQGPQ